MEEEGEAAAHADSLQPVSVRAAERTVTSDHPPVELPHGWRFGRYELLGRLAYGGMAEIYLARETAYGFAVRYVVIKRVLPHISTDQEFVGLFMDEARVAMSLTHPHICHIYEFGRIEGSYFLAMEWVNGVALNKIVKRGLKARRPIPVPYAVRIIANIAEALDYAHAVRDEAGKPLGIVHRDVTPHNIMLTFDGSAKLLDFGIAMAASRSTDTRTGLVRGKLAYMSPQQCLARGIDGRSDIFSLGVCLYEGVTGKRLYRHETDFEVCEAILKGPVPSIRDVNPELPEELDAIIQRCLAKEPEDRFQRAGELQTALEKYLAERREIVASTEMGQMLRDLFPDLYESGPSLDTKTDLLNSLPRVDSTVGPSLVVSSAPPASAAVANSNVVPSPVAPGDESTRTGLAEVTSSQTRTVSGPVGRGTVNVLLVVLLAAVGLAGFAVWMLATRPASVVVQSPPAPGRSTPATRESTPAPPVSSSDKPKRAEEPATEKAVAEPASALQGTLWINSDPEDAEIFINGNPTERRTPAQLEGFWPGAYRITLRKRGYETERTRVTVKAGEVTQSTVRMMTEQEAREFYRRRAKQREARQTEDEADPADEGAERRPSADDEDPSEARDTADDLALDSE